MTTFSLKLAALATFSLGLSANLQAKNVVNNGFHGQRTQVNTQKLEAYPTLIQELAPIVGKVIKYPQEVSIENHREGILPTPRGSVFFLGVYNNETLFATNAHVIPNDPIHGCVKVEIRLVDAKGNDYKLGCTKIVTSLTPVSDNSDVTIFSVGKAERGFFDFYGPGKRSLNALLPNQRRLDPTQSEASRLMTAGHGTHFGSSYRKQWDYDLSYSNACQPTHNAINFVRTKNAQAPILTVAATCMTTGGDSGSPVLDLNTGKIIGINTAGSKALSYSYYLPFSDIMPKLRKKLSTIKGDKMKKALNELLLDYGY